MRLAQKTFPKLSRSSWKRQTRLPSTHWPLAPGDARSLESLLHFLKGSALNLGFSDLALLCQTGERLAAQGEISTDLNQIRAVYAASKMAFTAGLDGLSTSAA